MWKTWVRSLGQKHPLEKAMATPSSILAWRIPWTEEPGRLQSLGLHRVGHDWVISPFVSPNEIVLLFFSMVLGGKLPQNLQVVRDLQIKWKQVNEREIKKKCIEEYLVVRELLNSKGQGLICQLHKNEEFGTSVEKVDMFILKPIDTFPPGWKLLQREFIVAEFIPLSAKGQHSFKQETPTEVFNDSCLSLDKVCFYSCGSV